MQDVRTERRELESDRARYRDLFYQAPDAYLVTDGEGTILEANRAAGSLAEPAVDLRGQRIRDLVHPESRMAFKAGWRRILMDGDAGDWRLRVRTGNDALRVMSVAVTRDDARDGNLYWLIRDVTSWVRAEAALTHRAAHDDLTGLPGRSMFAHVLGVAMARASRDRRALALLSLDLDRFKLVNDTLGRGAGDEILHETAMRLQAASRATDLVSRLGGDEFVVLLADLPRKAASVNGDLRGEPRRVMARISESLQVPFVIADVEIHLRVSMGVAMFPTQAGSEGDLIAEADRAMHRIKRANPTRTILFATDSQDALTRLAGLPRPPASL